MQENKDYISFGPLSTEEEQAVAERGLPFENSTVREAAIRINEQWQDEYDARRRALYWECALAINVEWALHLIAFASKEYPHEWSLEYRPYLNNPAGPHDYIVWQAVWSQDDTEQEEFPAEVILAANLDKLAALIAERTIRRHGDENVEDFQPNEFRWGITSTKPQEQLAAALIYDNWGKWIISREIVPG